MQIHPDRHSDRAVGLAVAQVILLLFLPRPFEMPPASKIVFAAVLAETVLASGLALARHCHAKGRSRWWCSMAGLGPIGAVVAIVLPPIERHGFLVVPRGRA